MNYYCRLFLLLILSLTISNSYGQNGTALPRKIVIDHTVVIDTSVMSLKDLQEQAVREFQKNTTNGLVSREEKALNDSLAHIVVRMIYQPSTEKKQTIIECNRDSIWKSFLVNGKMLGDWERISQEGNLFRHSKMNRNLCYDTVRLQEDINKYSVKYYRNDKKKILGYNCYKVVVKQRLTGEESAPFKTRTSIFTYYVTDLICIPLQAFQFLSVKIKGFPLEMITTEEYSKGYYVTYKVSSIEN